MKTTIEKVDISITTKKNSLPTSKAVAGRFRLYEENTKAAFKEEEGASVIYGEAHTKRLMRGKNCSVHWHDEKKKYLIRIYVDPNVSPAQPEWDFEECMNFIRRKILSQIQNQ